MIDQFLIFFSRLVADKDIIIIGKIRLIQSFQKNTGCNMCLSMQIFPQICLIISGIQHRIINAHLVRIIKTDPCHNIRIFFSQFLKLHRYLGKPPVLLFLSFSLCNIGFVTDICFCQCLIFFLLLVLTNYHRYYEMSRQKCQSFSLVWPSVPILFFSIHILSFQDRSSPPDPALLSTRCLGWNL